MQTLNVRGRKIGDRWRIVLRQKVDGTYTSFTGQAFRCQIRSLDGATLIAEASTVGGEIVFQTITVTDDTVIITFPASVTEDFARGTYKYELEWLDEETTLFGGKVNFVNDFNFIP
jgi:hypothetical protein